MRGAILRSAESVFSGHEFHAAAMDDIARRCGVGKGTLYRYFSSKDDLFLAVVREGLERLRAVAQLLGDARANVSGAIARVEPGDAFEKRRGTIETGSRHLHRPHIVTVKR